jgi:hypothetical protein
MGHVRLGKLPATRQWKDVIDLLGAHELAVAAIAAGVERCADRSLSTAVQDPGFVESFWLLLKIPQAAAKDDRQLALKSLGIIVPPNPGLADVTAGFEEAFDRFRQRCVTGFTDFAVIAKNAAIATLVSLTYARGPQLWTQTAEEERATVAGLASSTGFAELAQTFFTNVLRGYLRYFLDRELPRHIGVGQALASIPDAEHFDEAVRNHRRETTVIMRAFARDWIGRHAFHLHEDIGRENAAAFASYAFAKIRTELNRRSGSLATA